MNLCSRAAGQQRQQRPQLDRRFIGSLFWKHAAEGPNRGHLTTVSDYSAVIPRDQRYDFLLYFLSDIRLPAPRTIRKDPSCRL